MNIFVKEIKFESEWILRVEINYSINKMFIIGCFLFLKKYFFCWDKYIVLDVCDVFDEFSEVGLVIVCG